ncbi:MAG: hypothetical protein GW802_22030, partial [Armatimonadetes bacterium]|nr:hypothetical protein [Armatimonadota bacterium]
MPKLILFCALLLPLLLASAAHARTLHVSPEGNDRWSGQLAGPNAGGTDGPLASLRGARDALRKLREAASLAEPVQVLVAAGTYQLGEPFVLTPEDSGAEQCPITYEAAPGAVCVFEGGREVGGFKPAGGGLWTTTVPEVAAGKWYFEQLWVNGRRAVRARTP